jgi:WD40 repeat protein
MSTRDGWVRFVDWATRPQQARTTWRPTEVPVGRRIHVLSVAAGLLSLAMIVGSAIFSVFAGPTAGPLWPSVGLPQPSSRQQLADEIGARADQLGRSDPLAVLRLRLAAYTLDKTSARHRAALAQLLLGPRSLASFNPSVGAVTSLAFDASDHLGMGGRSGVGEAVGRSTEMKVSPSVRGDVADVSAVAYQDGQLWAATSGGVRPAASVSGGSAEAVSALARLGSIGWVAITRDGRLVVWDGAVVSGPPSRVLALGLTAGVLAATPDGRYVFTTGPGGVSVLDSTSGQLAARIVVTGSVSALSISADGHHLLVGHRDQASLFDVADPTTPKPGPVLLHPDGTVTAASLAPNGQTAVLSGGDTTTVWQLSVRGDPAQVAVLPIGAANAVAYSGDSDILATAAGVTVQTWSVAELLAYRPAQVQPAVMVRSRLAVGPVTFAALSSDGSYLITSGDSTTPAYVWNTRSIITGAPVLEYSSTLDAPIRQASAVGSLSKTTMVTVDKTGQATVWLVSNTGAFNQGRLATGVDGAVVTPDQDNVVTVTGTDATVWGLALRQQALGTLSYSAPTTALAAAPSGTTLIAGHDDGSVTVHAIDLTNTHATRRHLIADSHSPVDAIALAANAAVAVAAHQDGTVTVWDLTRADIDTGTNVPGAVGPGPHQAWLSATGDFAVISDAHGTTTLWSLVDRQTPTMLATIFTGGASLPVMVNTDASTAVQIKQDNTTVLWNLQPVLGLVDDPTSRACQLAGFTYEQWRQIVPDPNLNTPCLPPPVPALDSPTVAATA